MNVFWLHKPEIGMQYNECFLASQAGAWEAVGGIYLGFPSWSLGSSIRKQFK